VENVPAGCRFDSEQCTKHEYCFCVDSQPVVECPHAPIAAAHGCGMAATLAVIQPGDVTHRVLPTSVSLISWRNFLKTGDGGHELPKIWPKNSEIDSISARELIYAHGGRLETFATNGYARGLRTREMLSKIDTSHDGRISHDEYMTYQVLAFDLMDTSFEHKGLLTGENFLEEIEATGNVRRSTAEHE
jgi:hypothetical protein